jgi:hypothetical protein
MSALPFGGGAVLVVRSWLNQTESPSMPERVSEPSGESGKVVNCKGEPVAPGPQSVIGVPPPRADIDGVAPIVSIESEADDLAAVAIPLGNNDREVGDFGRAGRVYRWRGHAASASLVEVMTGLSRDCAQASKSPHR